MAKHRIAVALTLFLVACGSKQDSPPPESTSDATSPVVGNSPISIVSSSVSKNPLVAGQIQSASVTLTTTTTLQNLIVDIRIYDSANNMVVRKGFFPVTLTAGTQQLFTFDYQSPADMPPGQYNIQVGVWSDTWATTYLYATRDQFAVNATPATSQVSIANSSISRSLLVAGQVQLASVALTSSTTLQGMVVDIGIYDSANNRYGGREFSPVNLFAGSQRLLTFDFQSPPDLPPGQYNVQVGVRGTSGVTYLHETRDQFTVNQASFAMNCSEDALLSAGSYVVENNQWGKAGVTGYYSQCVANGGVAADGSVSARWTWTWPAGPSEIKAYPAIVFGQKPGYTATPNSNLPKQLNVISQATSSWSTRSVHNGPGQLTFDIWLTSDGQPHDMFVHTPITHEIMIAVEPYDDYGLTNRNSAWLFEEIVIKGVRYKVYKADHFGSGLNMDWRFIVFQMQMSMVRGELDLKALFDYLKSRGLAQGTEYLSSIEFGSEVAQGNGNVVVDSFKATVR